MCPANGELEHKSAETPVDFLCEVAHLRAMALGFEVPGHGECEFCPGGSHYSKTRESARKIAAKEINVGEWINPAVLLPILSSVPSSNSGCGGCGTHSHQ
jgi:hypothetical protein